MDRLFNRVTLLGLVAATLPLASLRAQSPAATPSATATAPQPVAEKRRKLLENEEKWKSLSKEERQGMRAQFRIHQQRIEKNVDELIKKNGWNFTPERRQQLIDRYSEERSKIELALRKEFEEKRRPLMSEMVERLKSEFTPPSTPTPATTP